VLIGLLNGCRTQPASLGPGPEDPNASKEFTTTDSGLRYRVLRKGNDVYPNATSNVKVDYYGWLDDGREFDSSYERRESATFNLSGVVPGWTEGIQLVSEGGMIELEIPSKLGYGDAGSPGSIPPMATLHFKVELHEVLSR
jgi:FKBP-type peptidyl-prolyl cis-trans isomerase FkpA